MKYLIPHSSNLVPKYKSTDMKKKLFVRLCTIAILCMASLAIKSETSSCKSICSCAAKNESAERSILLNDAPAQDYKYESFFIKI